MGVDDTRPGRGVYSSSPDLSQGEIDWSEPAVPCASTYFYRWPPGWGWYPPSAFPHAQSSI